MSMTNREELELRAARVREHLQSTAEELERKSGYALKNRRERTEDVEPDPEVSIAEPEALTASSGDSSDEDQLNTPERRHLERRADRVRERLADHVEALETKARERLLPIVVVGSALVLLQAVGFAWMFYRTRKLSR